MKKMYRKILSVFLALCIILSMVSVGMFTYSAATASKNEVGGLGASVLDKMKEIGLRVACNAVMSVSENAEIKGNDEIAKVTGLIAEWGLMSAEEAATTKNIEICNEILSEINELTALTNAGIANIESMIEGLSVEFKTDNLKDQKVADIDNVIKELSITGGVFEKYDDYVLVANKHKNGEVSDKELEKAQGVFLYSLRSYLGITQAIENPDVRNISDQIFGDTSIADKINQDFETVIGTLSANLLITNSHSSNVMQEAMKLAYSAYPFSHQQYDFIVSEVGAQVNTLVKVVCIYNEILALQSGYLAKIKDENNSDADALVTTYNTHAYKFSNTLLPEVAGNVNTMLCNEYTVANGVSLSIDDYMKSQDAVLTTLKINDETYRADGTSISQYNDFYKLMTMSGGEKKVYYLWNQTNSMTSLFGYSGSIVTNDFVNMEYPLSDGNNSYRVPSKENIASKYSSLTATSAFSVGGRKFRGILYDIDANGNSYSLIGSTTPMYLRTSSSVQDENPVTTDVLNVDTVFSGDASTEEFKGANVCEGDYGVLCATDDDSAVFSQSVSAETSGTVEGDLKIIVNDSTTISAGTSAVVPSGEKLTLKFKVPEDCANFKLFCKRNKNSFSTSLENITTEELLDESFADYLEVDSEGYYTYEYTMPYVNCSFELSSGTPDYDEQGRVLIENYDDLKNISYLINTQPDEYASLSYLLTDNIICPDNCDLQPIAIDNVKFSGIFDGQGYIIDNLNFDNTYSTCGFIANNAGTVKNIKFTDATMSGENVGVACGYNSGTIENITVKGATVSNTESGGVICGKNSGGIIRNCSVSDSTITGSTNVSDFTSLTFATGGIVGYLESGATVENCTSSATVSASRIDNQVTRTNNLGGIVGAVTGNSTVKLCSNTGNVSALWYGVRAGGVCGNLETGYISDCNNAGEVKLDTAYAGYAGGIVGNSSLTGFDGDRKVMNCYNSAKVISQHPIIGDYIGGIMGAADSLTLENCYYDSNNFSGGAFGELYSTATTSKIEGKTTDQFKSGEVAYLLNNGITDGTQAWYQNIDNDETTDTYPVLTDNGNNTVYKVDLSNKTYSNYETGVPALDVDENGNFVIATYEDLCKMAVMVNSGLEKYTKGSYILANDIDCTGKTWTHIGTDTIQFNGTLDGQGFSIIGLSRDAGIADGARLGLFAVLGENALVKNIVFSKADIFPSEAPVVGSGVIAKQNNGTISNCIITDSYIQLGNWVYLGAVAGLNTETGVIENCAVINTTLMRRWGASTTGSMGGISEKNNGVIKDCYTYNCSYKNGGTKAPITASGNNPENCYYYTTTDVDATYGIVKDINAFSSGEVAYLLNNGVTDGTQAWYQNLSGENIDNFPVLDNTHNTVYMNNGYTNGDLIGDVNADGKITEDDSNLLGKYLIRETALTLHQITMGDVNGDGLTNPMDLASLTAYINKTTDYEYGNSGKYGFNSNPTDVVLIGDVNFDGAIDSTDSDMIARFDVKLEEFDDKQLKAADVDIDCRVGVKDQTYVDLYIELGVGSDVAFIGMYSYEGFDSNIVGDSNTEPTTEPTTEPITEPTTEPTTEPITEPTTEPTTQQSTQNSQPTEPSSNEKTENTVESATSTEKQDIAQNPETGDTSNIGLWMMLAVLSLGFGVFVLISGKRDKGTRYR